MSRPRVGGKPFESFGPSLLSQQMRGKLVQHPIPVDRLAARKMLRDHCPLVPGVYGWIDRDGQLIYVGKSKSLRKRLLSYFARTPSDPKMGRIRQHGDRLVWEPVTSELLALIREQELIHRWRPDFNRQGQPTRTQPAYLAMSSGPAPNAFLARRLSAKATESFGPISGTNRLRQSVIAINQIFQLRDCPDKTGFEFNNQQLLFDDLRTALCIRHELGSCPGPCAARCSTSEYSTRVARAMGFLRGESNSILAELEMRMRKAAARHAYERAASLRDYLHDLTWLSRRLGILRDAATRLDGVLPIHAPRKRTGWMIMRAGRLVASATAPDRPSRAESTLRKLEKILASPPHQADGVLEMNLQVIVMSWLRKHPETANRLIPFERALEHCAQKRQPALLRSA